ncbi:hypothetical protein BU23DRAFT_89562 [Bimuria novae-zelandiae CBS 107.79]|uniref:Uncharacterized protein n=1 Tax=Bimuria novae-zelandiae CBS 107.79 TaxID=1447943 RepID=A0A6A5VD13_9PLEO|nr:hypothetical protein BU23DRAFT_89562 [Bimuria novae-zelandiae CBS 107.79]
MRTFMPPSSNQSHYSARGSLSSASYAHQRSRCNTIDSLTIMGTVSDCRLIIERRYKSGTSSRWSSPSFFIRFHISQRCPRSLLRTSKLYSITTAQFDDRKLCTAKMTSTAGSTTPTAKVPPPTAESPTAAAAADMPSPDKMFVVYFKLDGRKYMEPKDLIDQKYLYVAQFTSLANHEYGRGEYLERIPGGGQQG